MQQVVNLIYFKHAVEKGWKCLDNAPITFTEQVQNVQRYLDKQIDSNELGIFGAGWNLRSQAENLIGLGIYDKYRKIVQLQINLKPLTPDFNYLLDTHTKQIECYLIGGKK